MITSGLEYWSSLFIKTVLMETFSKVEDHSGFRILQSFVTDPCLYKD